MSPLDSLLLECALSGYFGGMTDTIIMRIADIQLTIPGILLAILINGIGRAILPFDQTNV